MNPLSVAQPSGCNLICLNPPLQNQNNKSEQRGVSEKCQSCSCIHSWQPASRTVCSQQCPSPAQTQCLLLPGQIRSNSNCKQWQQQKNCPTIAQVKEKKIRRLTKKSSVKRKKWTKLERKLIISERYFRGGGSCGICKDSRVMQSLPLFCWTSKDRCLIYVSFYVLTTRLR